MSGKFRKGTWGLAISVLAVVTISTPTFAQVFDTQALGQEVLWSDFFGVDARAIGMGNTGLALGHDGSALIYNPANLASVKRIELRAGFSHLRLTNETRLDIGGSEALSDGSDLSKTRINALSLAVPVPTYRGSLVFAFGLHRINSYDRAFGVTFDDVGGDDGAFRGREIETGGLWKWSAGGAVDISPRLSVGGALHLLTGKDEYRWDSRNATEFNLVTTEDQLIELDYVGVSALAGVSFNVSPSVSAGLTIETPTFLSADEVSTLETTIDTLTSNFVWYDVEEGFATYSVTRPFVFGFGMAGSFSRANIAADFRYTDWTQMDFDYDSPDFDAAENAALRFIQDELTDVLSIQLGGEYLLPEQGLTLRAGFFRDPLPVDKKYVEKQRQYITAGLGFLIDRVMTLDLAYVHGGYELRNDDPGTYNAEYKTRRVFATFGYRI